MSATDIFMLVVPMLVLLAVNSTIMFWWGHSRGKSVVHREAIARGLGTYVIQGVGDDGLEFCWKQPISLNERVLPAAASQAAEGEK